MLNSSQNSPKEKQNQAYLIYVYVFGFLLAALGSRAQDNNPAYKVIGDIQYRVFLASGTNDVWNRQFEVLVDGGKWSVESRDPKNTNIYQFTCAQGGLIYKASAVNQAHDPKLNDFAVDVESNDVPASDVSGTAAIWLALASEYYLNTVTNDQFKPIWRLDDPSLRREGFTTKGVLTKLNDGLPAELVYLNEGTIYAWSSGERILIKARPNCKLPVTNAFYHVLSKTNLDGFEIPASFEFIRKVVLPNFSTRMTAQILGKVDKVERIKSIYNELPQLKGKMYFVDRRFAKANQHLIKFNYFTTNNVFLDNSNNYLKAHEKVAILNQKYEQTYDGTNVAPSKKRGIIRAILWCSGVVPLLILIMEYKKQNKKTRL